MKLNIKATYMNLRRQPVISLVSIIGTALAIFLIMIVVMLSEVKTAPIEPESNRPRMLHNAWTSIVGTNNGYYCANGPMSYNTYKAIFGSMTTPETVTAYCQYVSQGLACEKGSTPVNVGIKEIDDKFWRVFDYDFVAGHPFDEASFEAGLAVAVVTESTAKAVFGSTDVTGRELQLNYVPYRVVGVIKDVSRLSQRSFGNVFIPFSSTATISNTWNSGIMGSLSATILAKDPRDFDDIRAEYMRNVVRYNKEIAPTEWMIKTFGRPYSQDVEALSDGSSQAPDVNAEQARKAVIYLILLIIPAINISSMTESRLRSRMTEIGVRRAFGCTRVDTLRMILSENLLVTLFAGAIGLVLSVAFAIASQSLLFNLGSQKAVESAPVDITSLLHWSTFLWALLFCFILNIFSTGIPAWKASRANIVDAINSTLSK